MSGNSAFELINQDGWQAGLKNMLRAEMNRWWKTRTWWIQCLIWIGAVDLILFMVVFASGSGTQLAMPPAELVSLYGVFGGMFTAIGIVIKMQGAIVGEKAEGTAAWVLSKPISRAAFVLSKLMGNAFGIAVTAMLVPGIVAYLVISIGIGEYLPVPDFMAGMGILYLFAFYWLAFTVMLGTFFNSRGAVIGIPLALILGQQFILGLLMNISPKIVDYLPFPLVMPPQDGIGSSIAGNLMLGKAPYSWMPIVSSIIAIAIFVGVGIWRFSEEEL